VLLLPPRLVLAQLACFFGELHLLRKLRVHSFDEELLKIIWEVDRAFLHVKERVVHFLTNIVFNSLIDFVYALGDIFIFVSVFFIGFIILYWNYLDGYVHVVVYMIVVLEFLFIPHIFEVSFNLLLQFIEPFLGGMPCFVELLLHRLNVISN